MHELKFITKKDRYLFKLHFNTHAHTIYNGVCYNERMLQRTVFINKIRKLKWAKMLQRTVFINKIRKLKWAKMLQRTVFINKIRKLKWAKMLQRTVFINKIRKLKWAKMLQRTVFINKIRKLKWAKMLQRKERNTNGRRGTRLRMTCLAFPLWLERQLSSLLSFVRFSCQSSSVICLFVQSTRVK
jgi:hypothetical protein